LLHIVTNRAVTDLAVYALASRGQLLCVI